MNSNFAKNYKQSHSCVKKELNEFLELSPMRFNGFFSTTYVQQKLGDIKSVYLINVVSESATEPNQN